jgi:PEP-CTERM motif
MSKKLALASMLVICMTILSGTVWADNISIVNPSFESIGGPLNATCGTGCAFNYGPVPGVPGWAEQDGGSWQPGAYFSSIPDGSLVGFTNTGGSLTQTLTGTSVLANSLYTFSVYVGDRTDGDSGIYNLSLDTILGGVTTTLCNISGNAANIASGTFQLETCSYLSGSNVPSGNLFLQMTAVTQQLDVDDVSLTVQPASSVPEPSSVLLLGVGMVFLAATFMVRKSKEVRLAA